MSTWLALVVIVAGALACATVLTLGVTLLRKGRNQLLSNEGGSPALRAITATYGLLLAFVLATSLQAFLSARQRTVDEAESVVGLADLTLRLPARARPAVRRALACYADTVASREFPAMRSGEPLASDRRALDRIYMSLPKKVSAGQGALLPELTNLTTARIARLRAADSSLPTLLWIVVIVGAVVVLFAVTAVTVIDRAWMQFAVLTGLSVVLIGAIILIYSFGKPFSNPVAITPGPMKSALESVARGVPRPYCASAAPAN